MPAADKSHATLKINRSATGSLHGSEFHPANEQELSDAIDIAFDYRGDVTLTLKDGSQILCFVANRLPQQKKLTYYIKDNDEPQQLDYSAITAISLSGEDPADGKSWEAWMTKKADQRAQEAERLRQEALARGEL